MDASRTLIESLLGVAEAVAAYGDHLDTPEGEHLAEAAREAIDAFWAETADYPPGARAHRDEVFSLLLNTRAARVS
jgi:hypothetical protein